MSTTPLLVSAGATRSRPDTLRRGRVVLDQSWIVPTGDILLSTVALLASNSVGFGRQPQVVLPWLVAYAALWLALAHVIRAYQPRTGALQLAATWRVAVLGIAVLVLVGAAPEWAVPPVIAGRPFALNAFVVLATLAMWRTGSGLLLRGLQRPRRVLLLGRNQTLSAVRRELRARGRAPETMLTFDESAYTTGVSDVVIDPTIAYPHRVQVALLELAAQGVAVHTAADMYEGLTRRALLISGSVGVVAPGRFAGTPYIGVRRVIELLVVAVAIVLTAPLVLIACVAVMIDSPGPPLYRQERVGLNGRNFRMLKMRTMRQYAEANGKAVWARANDPRVTRVGSLLRRSRLDELPQLWNVLRGDMSLIGPRPERPDFVAVLDRRLPLYHARHAVRPGITGWAQVQLGYTATMKGALTKLEYDLYYIRHRTALLDLAIVFKTLIVVFRLEGR